MVLRKGSSGLHIWYTDTNFTSYLTGREFSIALEEGKRVLKIDLTHNGRSRNQVSEECYDFQELIKKQGQIKSIQFADRQIFTGIAGFYSPIPDWAIWLILTPQVWTKLDNCQVELVREYWGVTISTWR